MTTASRPRRSPGLPAISERALNRTTLLGQSLLERAADAPADAIHRLADLQAQYANSPYVALGRGWATSRSRRLRQPLTIVRSSRPARSGTRSTWSRPRTTHR